jgi:DnaJ-domain-containing protein 1
MDSGMAHAMERFPEHATSIHDRFHADQSFREMCADYADALQALQRWQASRGPYKAPRVEEYRELARSLEIEIVTALRSPAPGT